MSNNKDRVPLAGSEKAPVPGAKEIGSVDPNEKIDATVILKPKQTASQAALEIAKSPLKKRRHLSRQEFASAHGASSNDFEKIRQFASENGLTVKELNPSRRSVTLSGPVAQMSQAFGSVLKRYEHPN